MDTGDTGDTEGQRSTCTHFLHSTRKHRNSSCKCSICVVWLRWSHNADMRYPDGVRHSTHAHTIIRTTQQLITVRAHKHTHKNTHEWLLVHVQSCTCIAQCPNNWRDFVSHMIMMGWIHVTCTCTCMCLDISCLHEYDLHVHVKYS